MTKNLIYDDGLLRDCEYNKDKIGFWRTWWQFHSYGKCFYNLWYYLKTDFIDDIKGIIGLCFYVLFLPCIPFVTAYFDYKKSKFAVSKELGEHEIPNY
jgi:hypothetical protein